MHIFSVFLQDYLMRQKSNVKQMEDNTLANDCFCCGNKCVKIKEGFKDFL